jgi:hypothetical protein
VQKAKGVGRRQCVWVHGAMNLATTAFCRRSQAVHNLLAPPPPHTLLLSAPRQDHQGLLWHHQVLQRLPQGRPLQQLRLPVPPRNRWVPGD